MHDLTVSHLLVVVRIYHLKQSSNFLLLINKNSHLPKKLSEFLLLDDTVAISVDILK